ncbi:S-adenosylmethionine--2-demethylmenaquinone methyltransferase [Enemella evansiae]|uniref:4-carboxy-4-hydroxy-2-oxoadipate aldolase/oxaloacetate decarboxylase n=1 Tax=Enemella evansiae TaxID=2016499 RepID=UPI000B975F19|nr:4-carboxy-4-hydroxy-2-oxoadipate aldolase/oxaloacetate decarboxylase [Enemella evansiae]OYN98017.1 S-adenosylmethionine--2-demethylmenaquinone methyltransferase [Enemella evansiae]
MTHVVLNYPKPDPALVARLGAYSAAHIHESQGRTGQLDPGIKPIDREMAVCGPAFTVVCHPRDNLMLQVAISYARPGDVLVVSSGDLPAGQFGDVLANACQARGIAGLVTDGGVRDTREIRELGFPVFSKYVSIQGTVKESIGPLNHPLNFGGQRINPGDVVKADCDGVVVVARTEVESVLGRCAERETAEIDFIRRYWAGETPIDISDYSALLAAKGLTVGDA